MGYSLDPQAGGGTTAVDLPGIVDTNNSTTATLADAGVFTGTGVEVKDYSHIGVTVYADVAGILQIEFSNDGVDWHESDTFTFVADSYKTYSFQPVDRYFRVVFTNGATPQTEFHITTLLRPVTAKPSSHRLNDDLSGEDDATLSKSVVAARIPNGKYSNVDASAGGALRVVVSEENQDAFGRVRTSDPVALLDSTFFYNLNPRSFESLTNGNGVVAHDTVRKAGNLSITAGALGQAGLQSYQYTHYNPGKSHLCFITFCADRNDNGFAAGQKFEVGYFDDGNGIFARFDDGGVNFVQRSGITGSPVETEVEQANWNIDPMDGTGPSGMTLDITKSQILVIDLQFLGVGRVRMGFDISGYVFFAHAFDFANLNPGMYMQTGSLPVRWLLTDTGTTGFDDAEAYCCMVSSEGGQETNRGIQFARDSGALKTAAAGVDTHVISIRPKTTFNGIVNRIWNILEECSLYNAGNGAALVKIWYGGSLTGSPSWADVDTSDSGMEWDKAGTWSAGTGIVIDEFYVPATVQARGAAAVQLASRLPITLNKAGTTPVGMISITAAGVGAATPDVYGVIKWREIR